MRRVAGRIIASLALLAITCHAVRAGKRVALIVGNSSYINAPALANPKNDAQDMAAALKALGFTVILGVDLDKRAMDRKILEFAGALSGADAGIFHYSGHGLQVAGVNYLVPVDASLETAAALDFEALRLDLVQRTMERETKTNILFVDACRNNPLSRNLARALGTRSTDIGRGLAPIESGAGTLISFSTQPGNVALDGTGRNSPYSGPLVKAIATPGEDVLSILTGVRNEVMAATGDRQVPWDNNALRAKFYFNPAAASAQPQAPLSEAAQAWDQIKNSKSITVFEAFRKQYSTNAVYDVLAVERIAELKRIQAMAAAAPATEQKAILSKFDGPKRTIKIGVLNDRALYSDMAGEGSVVAARMAAEDFEIADSDIRAEVLAADHQNKPDVGVGKAREWYDQDSVAAIFDVPNSGVALAISALTEEKNKVFIASGAATSDLTGAKCSPNTVHWTYDTWALSHGTSGTLVRRGADTWFFITADYAFGTALERDTASVVRENGGRVVGSVRAPLNTQDFSSYLLQAQSTGAKIIGLENAGGDTTNSIRQASELGLVKGGQNLAGWLVSLSDIHSLGLKTAQGVIFTTAFYWDFNDQTRAWSDRFFKAFGKRPTMVQAGVYSAVLHYLKAVSTLKNPQDGKAIVARMKNTPTDDPLFGKGQIRPDGRKIHDMYVVQVKKPEESKGEWDYYKVLATIPGEQAFRPLNEGGCPLAERVAYSEGARR